MTQQINNPFINQDWLKAEKKIDEQFEGSLFQAVGLSKEMCPVCEAHLKEVDGDLICLNACHLVKPSQAKFHAFLLSAINIENVIKEARIAIDDTKGGDQT